MPFTATNVRMTNAFPGMLVDASISMTESYVNEEASAELPFGVMLQQGTGERGAKLCTAPANKFIGVLRHQSAYNLDNELGTIGLKPKVTLGILVLGKIYVSVNEAVTPASDVRVRCDTNAAANGAVGGPGTFCTTTSAGHTALVKSFCKFTSTTTGAGVAELFVDMSGRNNAVAE